MRKHLKTGRAQQLRGAGQQICVLERAAGKKHAGQPVPLAHPLASLCNGGTYRVMKAGRAKLPRTPVARNRTNGFAEVDGVGVDGVGVCLGYARSEEHTSELQ